MEKFIFNGSRGFKFSVCPRVIESDGYRYMINEYTELSCPVRAFTYGVLSGCFAFALLVLPCFGINVNESLWMFLLCCSLLICLCSCIYSFCMYCIDEGNDLRELQIYLKRRGCGTHIRKM